MQSIAQIFFNQLIHCFFTGPKIYTNDLSFLDQIDLPKEISENRPQVTLDPKTYSKIENRLISIKKEAQNDLTSSKFRENLSQLIGKQEESAAIDFTLKTFVIVKDSPKLAKTFFDFSEPLPRESFAFNFSLERLASILKLTELLFVFKYIELNLCKTDGLRQGFNASIPKSSEKELNPIPDLS